MTELMRGRSGDVVHRADCRHAAGALPWLWAEGKVRAEIKSAEVNGLRMCKVCKPLDAVPKELP